MPNYAFKCECGEYIEIFVKKFNPPPPPVCIICDVNMYRDYSGTQVATFEPFTTSDITGKPIDITSAEQRDRLLKKHDLTMDNFRYSKLKKKTHDWQESVTFEKVKEAIDKGVAVDEVPEDPELQHLPMLPKKVTVNEIDAPC